MTVAERADVMTDLFGKQCVLDNNNTYRKRAKRDLDLETRTNAIRQMKQELQTIPKDEKMAFLQAQAKLSKSNYETEFGDHRMMRFLQFEGMNPKLAAQRVVFYWESRLEVFGPQTFLLPMTLDGALKDDLVAIEFGVAYILPQSDSSGRPILYVEPHRLSMAREQHSLPSKSVLRAFWYLMEVLSEAQYQGEEETDRSTSTGKGFVSVTWTLSATVWDYDHYVYSRLQIYQERCFPIHQAGAHACCPDWISRNIIDPVVAALVSKDSRLRRMYHCVAETEIIGVLSEYGILSDMLPTDMGGSVELARSQSEWMTNRNALERAQVANISSSREKGECKGDDG